MIDPQETILLERLVNRSGAMQVIRDVKQAGLRWDFYMQLSDQDRESMRQNRIKHLAELFGVDDEKIVTNEIPPPRVNFVYNGNPQEILKRPGFEAAVAYFFTSRRAFVILKPQGDARQEFLVHAKNASLSYKGTAEGIDKSLKPTYEHMAERAKGVQEKLVKILSKH